MNAFGDDWDVNFRQGLVTHRSSKISFAFACPPGASAPTRITPLYVGPELDYRVIASLESAALCVFLTARCNGDDKRRAKREARHLKLVTTEALA
jgi:hypothetical protein